MSLLPKSIHRCRRYPTTFNSGRDIPERASAYASNVGRLTFDELSVDQIVAGEDALRMSIDFAAALRP